MLSERIFPLEMTIKIIALFNNLKFKDKLGLSDQFKIMGLLLTKLLHINSLCLQLDKTSKTTFFLARQMNRLINFQKILSEHKTNRVLMDWNVQRQKIPVSQFIHLQATLTNYVKRAYTQILTNRMLIKSQLLSSEYKSRLWKRSKVTQASKKTSERTRQSSNCSMSVRRQRMSTL